jgi:hypothetical protein
MTHNEIERAVGIFESFGLIGEDVSDLVRELVAEDYNLEIKALINFGAIDLPAMEMDYYEVDLPGEICPDYEEVMQEFMTCV